MSEKFQFTDREGEVYEFTRSEGGTIAITSYRAGRIQRVTEFFVEDAEKVIVGIRRAMGIPLERTAEEPDVCPFDCDNCHDPDCPCDRLGCAGHDAEG